MRSFLTKIFLLVGICAQAQSDTYRNKNWHPEKGEFYFLDAITWEFLNETYPPDDERYAGNFTVYVDPPTGTMLFTSGSYGQSSEMTDFVIIFQNGRYIEGFTDEFGRKNYLVDTLAKFKSTVNNQEWINADFGKLIKHTGKSKVFGENNYGWPTVKAKGYELSYLLTNEKSNVYLSKQPYSLLPIYLFNELESEAKLPVNFNFSQVIPLQYWVVEDLYFAKSANSKREPEIRVMLKSVSPTEYFVNLSDYQLLK